MILLPSSLTDLTRAYLPVVRRYSVFFMAGFPLLILAADTIKRAFTHEESSEIILKGDGRTEPTHFDPRVLEAFSQLGDEFLAVQKNS